MKRQLFLTIFVVLALVFDFANVSSAIAATSYTLIDLGTLVGNNSYPVAINEAGQVIGYSYLADNIGRRAFVWEDGVMTDLTLGGSSSRAEAINESGQVVGWSSLAGDTSHHAFLWEGGVMSDLGTLGGINSAAVAINEAGQVLGVSSLTDGNSHAFVWEGGAITDLGTLGGSFSEPVAINEAGQILGVSSPSGNTGRHAFVWEGGVMTDLGTLGGSYVDPVAINEAGQVIGYAITANAGTLGFVWEDGVMTALTLGGSYSYTIAINEAGQVIGMSSLANGAIHAFVWQGGVMTDLTLGGFNGEPVAINEAGQVLGFSGYMEDDTYHAFVWQDGVTTDLTLGGSKSMAYAMNEAGQVIGYSYLAGDTRADAFVWQDGVMTDLGTLGGSFSNPVAINEAGQVIGYSYLTGNAGPHAFIAEEVGNTPSGSDITVSPGSDTTLTFANVSSAGQTTVTTSSSAPPLPEGFSLGDPPTFYDISTTATYSPPVTVCITYDPAQYGDPANLHLLHYENDAWVDVTTSNDTTNHIVCGQVSSLSPFAVAETIYNFSGFFQPVDNLPTLNVVKAGSAVPVKFSLGGDQDLDIFDTGYPKSQVIACDSTAPVAGIEEMIATGSTSLSYDPDTNQYSYVWKTDKAWANTCRQLVMKLNDGTYHRANFKFSK